MFPSLNRLPGRNGAQRVAARLALLACALSLAVGAGKTSAQSAALDTPAQSSVTRLSSNPDSYAALNGKMLFAAGDSEHGRELWMTDGTMAGTALVKDLAPGVAGSGLKSLIAFGAIVVFAARDGQGWSLWKSDGTADGTVVIKRIADSAGDMGQVIAVNGTLFFAAWNGKRMELWRSDGSAEGTIRLKQGAVGNVNWPDMTGYHSLMLGAFPGDEGYELWRSDGTVAGTQIVRDIDPGPNSGIAGEHFFIVGDALYFVANTVENGVELWTSDGTALGTRLSRDTLPGPASGWPTHLTVDGAALVFTTSALENGIHLWRLDTAADRLTSIKTLNPNAEEGTLIFDIAAREGMIFFMTVGNDAPGGGADAGAALWRSDGTTAGTAILKRFILNPVNILHTDRLTVVGTMVVFAARTAGPGRELWRSDGTAAGTVLIKDIYPGDGSGYPGDFAIMGDTMLFSAVDPLHGRELWRSNGTADGTSRLRDIAPDNLATVFVPLIRS